MRMNRLTHCLQRSLDKKVRLFLAKALGKRRKGCHVGKKYGRLATLPVKGAGGIKPLGLKSFGEDVDGVSCAKCRLPVSYLSSEG